MLFSCNLPWWLGFQKRLWPTGSAFTYIGPKNPTISRISFQTIHEKKEKPCLAQLGHVDDIHPPWNQNEQSRTVEIWVAHEKQSRIFFTKNICHLTVLKTLDELWTLCATEIPRVLASVGETELDVLLVTTEFPHGNSQESPQQTAWNYDQIDHYLVHKLKK